MAIIVVGGGGRGAGKTALICGLIRALPEIEWTAAKITSDEYGQRAPIWEESLPGDDTDTARYLAAGAQRALLVTADDAALSAAVEQVLKECPAASGVIFESNRILRHLRPDVCLAAACTLKGERKASFELVEQCMDATVSLGGHDHVIEGERMHFHLASLERVSAPMLAWLRERLEATAG